MRCYPKQFVILSHLLQHQCPLSQQGIRAVVGYCLFDPNIPSSVSLKAKAPSKKECLCIKMSAKKLKKLKSKLFFFALHLKRMDNSACHAALFCKAGSHTLSILVEHLGYLGDPNMFSTELVKINPTISSCT